MVKFSYLKNISFCIILIIFLNSIHFNLCKSINEKLSNDRVVNDFDKDNIRPDERTDDTDKIMEEIQAARDKKERMEIESQEKKIYVIALGVLSGIFLILIIIYSIFKCYLFCLSKRNEGTPLRRIRISKLGQVYVEENFDATKSAVYENDEINNANTNDKNDAPTCFDINKNEQTFNPENYTENNQFYKPVDNN